ncbi:hypothetical protein LSTR_LSTR012149 [Laodelphax striatellus]|uniref:ubiquitinyl hydrolase 1 n=1 Tax=Laodelphax striatellus TaxID=195883 RepID=A0A482X1F6_LAOST|nr:hypothetical protein LSTR_LSTR012149 [Laodelphax striatellus]
MYCLCAEYLSTYKLDHRAALLKPRGLTNRSNYCYINATLQALLACPPLYNLLKKLPVPPRKSHSASKSKTPIIDSMVQFVNEFEEMVGGAPSLLKSRRDRQQAARDDKQQTETVAAGAAFEPTYVYRMMNTVIRNESAFPVEGRQEDAEEFLSCLLNGLNDEMVELLRLTDDNMSNGEVIATNGDNYHDQDSDNEWKEISKKKPTITRRTKLVSTPLSQIFQGQWRSRVVRQGASETDNIQPFFTFPLDIEKAHSVKEALEHITTRNMLEGFTCPKTNRTIEAYQQLYLEELPLVLLLHLKCFDYRLQTCSKIIKNVEFSIELKIEPKLMATTGKKNNNNNNTNNNRSPGSSMKEREYKLFAVVYHDGKEATKGHYVTDVYHVGYGTWLRYDDANVRAVSQNAVLTPRAPRVPYLLYYRRKDTIAPPPTNAKPQKTAANES